MSSRRLRLFAICAAATWLLSSIVGIGLADPPVRPVRPGNPLNVSVANPDKDIGVGYGDFTENTVAFDLEVNLNPPDNQTIVSSESRDEDVPLTVEKRKAIPRNIITRSFVCRQVLFQEQDGPML